jgi:type I restriction enzyme, S subunit
MTLETFFNKFDLFADAPDAVAKMRELVRHLAVTGTLVEQDDNDEPALALLDKIAAHKAALAKNGKLRGPTAVSPMSPDDHPRVLPSSWTWVRFGEIVVNRDGERIPVSKEERTTKAKTYDYYGASGVIDKIDGYLFDKPLLLIGEDGANLINRSTPIAFMARGQYWVNNHAHVLDGISEDFLRYIELHINAINLEPYVTGSAQPKMNQAKMNSIPIALPPLAEQKRIVAKVDELMALCDRLEAQQQERETRHAALARASLARFADAPTPANLPFLFHPSYAIPPADLRKSILTLAVQGKLVPQDPNDEPADDLLANINRERLAAVKARRISPMKPLPPVEEGEIAYDLRPGRALARLIELVMEIQTGPFGSSLHQSDYQVGGTPVINPASLKDGKIVPIESMAIGPDTLNRLEVFRLNEGDIVMARRGEMGRCAIVTKAEHGWLCGTGSLVLRMPSGMYAPFLALLIGAPEAREYLGGASVGTTMQNLNQGILAKMPVGVPPLAEQRRIVAKVEQLMALVDALETQLAASRATAANLLSALVAELTLREAGMP